MPPTSTGRLRSKTSDLSDLLRGKSAEPKHTETRSVPPTQDAADAATPPKGRFAFLGRRRKTSSTSPSPSSSRASSDPRRHDEEVPPVPTIDVSRLSTSTITARRSSSTPSSPTTAHGHIPPSNVPPPSVDATTHLSRARGQPQTRASYAGQIPEPQKVASAIPVAHLRHLRTQKSTSFEFTRQSNDSASTADGRPIITISAPPPHVEDNRDRFTAPRAAPAPPPASATPRSTPAPPSASATPRSTPAQPPASSSSRIARKAPPPPTSSPSPPSSSSPSPPSFMRFSRPPADPGQGPVPPPKEEQAKRRISEPRSHGLFSSRKSVGSAPPPPEPSSPTSKDRARNRPSALPMSLPKLMPKQDRAPVVTPQKSISELSTTSQSASDSGQAPSTSASPTRRRIPIGPTSMRMPSMKPPPPSSMKPPSTPVATLRRLPSSGPPTEPLPSPPPGAPKGPEEHPFPTIPSFPSVGRRSVISNAPQDTRTRTNTVSSLASSISAGRDRGDTAPSSPVEDREKDRDSLRPPVSTSTSEADEPAGGGSEVASVEQLRDALRAQSAKYARLSAYLLTLTERHAVEKNELARRVEALEREARKREREITGLRWLVMNANQQGGSPSPVPDPGLGEPSALPRVAPLRRLRSGSKSSQASNSPGMHDSPMEGRGAMSSDSHTGSMEEGLFEMQKSVSDFIAPPASPPSAELGVLPGGSTVTGRLKRSNTLPDSLAQVFAGAKPRQARRTSSPVVAGAGALKPSTSASSSAGLGIDMDMPSIPSLPGTDDEHMSAAPSTASTSSLPSLAAVNTASSGLSAIPESPGRPSEGDRREKEERRASRALKRVSATSSVSASTAYSNNLNLDASPSIGQVLDRATEKESDMDAIMRKLRVFGSS